MRYTWFSAIPFSASIVPIFAVKSAMQDFPRAQRFYASVSEAAGLFCRGEKDVQMHHATRAEYSWVSLMFDLV